MTIAFIDNQRSKGHRVTQICDVLTGQGLQVSARTYGPGKPPPPATATLMMQSSSTPSWPRSAHRKGCMADGKWRPTYAATDWSSQPGGLTG